MSRIESKEYNRHEYDSLDEVFMAMWLEEAEKAGYVKAWVPHPKTYVVVSNSVRFFNVKGKTAKKPWLERSEAMFSSSSKYTPDFLVWWKDKAFDGNMLGKLEPSNSEDMIEGKIKDFAFMAQKYKGYFYTMVDIKPSSFGIYPSHREFGLKSRLMWEKHGIYIKETHLLNPKKKSDCMFSKLWAPKKYLEQLRKDGKGYYAINCERKYLEDYGKK